MKKIKVNLVSESEFTVQGHGVHTAFVEMKNALSRRKEILLDVNSKKNNYDIVHLHTIGFFAFWRLFSGKKRVISAHLVLDSFVGSLKLAKIWRPFAKMYLRFYYNRADLVLAVSDYTKKELEDLGVKKPIKILYNFIDTEKYKTTKTQKLQARKDLNLSAKDFVVIGSGQVQPRKKVDVFVKMAEKMPDVKFIWVGGVPFGALASENQKMQKIMKNPPKNLTFTGVIPLEEVAKYYASGDIFALPSVQETFGLVAIEAASSSLPVILRDISDYDDTFRPHALFAKNDDEFADLVQKLRDDKDFYSSAVKKSEKLAKKYDSKPATEKLIKFYKEVLDL